MAAQETTIQRKPDLLAEWCPAHRYHDPNKGLHNGTFELVGMMIREKLQGEEYQEQNTEV